MITIRHTYIQADRQHGFLIKNYKIWKLQSLNGIFLYHKNLNKTLSIVKLLFNFTTFFFITVTQIFFRELPYKATGHFSFHCNFTLNLMFLTHKTQRFTHLIYWEKRVSRMCFICWLFCENRLCAELRYETFYMYKYFVQFRYKSLLINKITHNMLSNWWCEFS